jgi:hypothetical protein
MDDNRKSHLETSAGTIFMGDYFEAKTKKGGTNLIVFFFEKDGYVYYCHGDRAKKCPKSQWTKSIDYGDMWPVDRSTIQPDRIALSVLAMQAMANGMAFNDYVKVAFGDDHGSPVGEFETFKG